MPRARVARARKNLAVLPRSALPTSPAEASDALAEVWTATLERWRQAGRELAAECSG